MTVRLELKPDVEATLDALAEMGRDLPHLRSERCLWNALKRQDSPVLDLPDRATGAL